MIAPATPPHTRAPEARGASAPGVAASLPAPYQRVPVPRTWSVRASDVVALAVGNAVMIVAMWVRHGGPDHLGSVSGMFTAAGQLAALLGTYVALLGLLLVSRSPWLDQLFGTDGLLAAHRWTGFATVSLLAGHVVLTSAGYALGGGTGLLDQFAAFLGTYPYVLWAAPAMVLFIALGLTSMRAARRRVSYETWYGIHLYAYLAVTLGFAHQLAVGSDFVRDPVARAYWIGLYVAVASLVIVFRVGQPIALSIRHRLRVSNVVQEGPGVVSIYVTGRDLDRLAVRSGQYFVWRFLARDGWWRGHPFSLSAAPNGAFLRLTVKALGDDSRELQHLRVGTPAFVEGPYGALTGARRTRQRVALIAGGIGIAPLRALLEDLPAAPGDLTLIYRASSFDDLVLRRELDALASLRGAAVHYIAGRRGTPEMPGDPLAPAALLALVPDVRDRDVFVCGPLQMMDVARRSLVALGVPSAQVHLERFNH
jgi:predicted ferric reductase